HGRIRVGAAAATAPEAASGPPLLPPAPSGLDVRDLGVTVTSFSTGWTLAGTFTTNRVVTGQVVESSSGRFVRSWGFVANPGRVQLQIPVPTPNRGLYVVSVKLRDGFDNTS